MSGLRLVGVCQGRKVRKVPGDYVAEECVVVGDERGLEFNLRLREVGKGWSCHWAGGEFLSGGAGFVLERADESTHR